MTNKLNAGNQFPQVRVPLHGDGELNLPLPIDTGYQVLLFYRGMF